LGVFEKNREDQQDGEQTIDWICESGESCHPVKMQVEFFPTCAGTKPLNACGCQPEKGQGT
jgi:hypothetical protein